MTGTVVALSGGVGGAKLALGLSHVLEGGELTVVANTADDFRYLDLAVSPDLDTLVYTLAGIADPVQGWGRRGETWSFMQALEGLGGETWFRLGDGDIAMHVERTRCLRLGESLELFTRRICRMLGIRTHIFPMSNDPIQTRLRTDRGWMEFQDYFVRHQCTPEVREIAFEGADSARATPAVLDALHSDDLRAIVICPSNPFLSIDPILAVPGIREALSGRRAPVVAVSPLVGGRAVKGPTAKIMRELGLEVTSDAVASHYTGLLDVLVVDDVDSEATAPRETVIVTAPTLMQSLEDRQRLARTVLASADAFANSQQEYGSRAR